MTRTQPAALTALTAAAIATLAGCAGQVGSAGAEVVDQTITVDAGALTITGIRDADELADATQPREWLLTLTFDDGIRPRHAEIDGALVDATGAVTPAGERLRRFFAGIDPQAFRALQEMLHMPPAADGARPLSGSTLAIDLSTVLSARPAAVRVDVALPPCSADSSFYDCVSSAR